MSACEEYGSLISAMIDDELSAEERFRVDEHLQSCSECRRRAAVFAELNQLAALEVPMPPIGWGSNIQRRAQIRRRKRRVSWAATYLAAAAVLIVMVGTVWHFRDRNSNGVATSNPAEVVSRKQGTTQTPDNDVIGPLETLQIVSRQKQRTHATMRKLMEWDLRALKLELKQMDLSPDQAEQLGHRIDQLIERVGQAGHETNATGIGESI